MTFILHGIVLKQLIEYLTACHYCHVIIIHISVVLHVTITYCMLYTCYIHLYTFSSTTYITPVVNC